MRNVLRLIIVFLLILIIIFLLWWFFFRNQPPKAVDNALATVVETAVSGNIIVDDHDPELKQLQLETTPVTSPGHGSVQLVASGEATYMPEPGFSGNDQFRYRVCDPQNKCAEANVTIAVNPVAVDEAVTAAQNTAVLGNVLTNDKGSSLAATAQSTTELTLQVNGDFTFTPAVDFTGTTTFSYEVCDPTPLCDSGEVTVNVVPIGFKLEPDSYTTRKNTAVSGSILDNDSPKPLLVTTTPTVSPTNGIVTLEASGVFTYTPNTDFVGSDTFTYEVCDGGCLTAPVTITVTDGLIVEPDVMITYVNNAVPGNVLANDLGDGLVVNLSVSPSNGPTNGQAEMQTDGTTIYTPNTGFTGTDTFTYEACDNTGNCGQTTVTVEIADPPDTLLHTVEPGEWLLQIARCYGTTVSAIRMYNHIPYPDLIFPGQVLTIHNVGSAGPFQGPPCVQSHTVAAGETLASIANTHDITESELARVNGLYSYYYYGYYGHGCYCYGYGHGYYPYYYYKGIYVGQKLIVPRPVPDYMQPNP